MTTRSRKGAVQNKMNIYRADHPICERCQRYRSSSVHHIQSAGMGGRPKDSPVHQEENWLALCMRCHEWAESHPAKARVELTELKKRLVAETCPSCGKNWLETETILQNGEIGCSCKNRTKST